MRTKGEILIDSLDAQKQEPVWDKTMSKHEQLTIEVWIDIRDQLTDLITILSSVEKIGHHGD